MRNFAYKIVGMNSLSVRNTLQPQLLSLCKEDALWAMQLLQTVVDNSQTMDEVSEPIADDTRTDFSQAISAMELRNRLRPRIKEIFE